MTVSLLATALFLQTQAEIDAFLKASRDKDPDVRARAVDDIDKHRTLKMVELVVPLLADEHPRVRFRAVKALYDYTLTRPRRLEEAAVQWLIETGLKSQDEKIRAGVAEGLGNMGAREAGPGLVALLSDPSADVRAAAAWALGKLKESGAAEALAKLAAGARTWTEKVAALDALAQLGTGKDELVAALEDKAYQVRLVAIENLPRVDKAVAMAHYVKVLDDADWRVRVAAIEAATEIREPDCVDVLIHRLEKEKGRLRYDIVLALEDLTDKDFGYDAKRWMEWWKTARENFKPAAKKSDRDRRAHDTGVQFFDVPIVSDRFSFVLDLSGSMRDPATDASGKPVGKSKLEIIKQETVKTLQALKENVSVNLVLIGSDNEGRFNRNEKLWKPRLQPMTAKNREEIIQFAKRLEARGFTNIYDALMLAFEDESVDTLYLYSDGGASRGTFIMVSEILEQVRRTNRYRKIMIHCIQTVSEKTREYQTQFMAELARATKGIHVKK